MINNSIYLYLKKAIKSINYEFGYSCSDEIKGSNLYFAISILSAVILAALSSYSDIFGRKSAFILVNLTVLVGNMMSILGNSVAWILIGFSLTNFGTNFILWLKIYNVLQKKDMIVIN